MTRKDLNNLFVLRERIERAESMLVSIRERSNPGAQVLTGMPHAPGVKDKTGDYAVEIVSLEERIAGLREELSQSEKKVETYLDGVEDECVSTALRLRYIRGLLWKEVAYTLGQPKKSLTDQCYQFLRTLDDGEDSTPSDTDVF